MKKLTLLLLAGVTSLYAETARSLVLVVNDSGAQRGICAGSVIQPRWILTAAHCADGGTTSNMFVYREIDVNIPIVSIIRHGGYSSPSIDNDIALLHLAKRVPGTHPIRMIPKGHKGYLRPGLPVTVLGAQLAMFVENCPSALLHNGFPSGRVFCTSGEDSVNPIRPPLGLVKGDSGRPAVIGYGNDAQQIGIASSWYSPWSFFVNLADYRDWIDQTIDRRTARFEPEEFVVDIPYGGLKVTLRTTEDGRWMYNNQPFGSGSQIRLQNRSFILFLENGEWTAHWSSSSFRLDQSCYKIRAERQPNGWRPLFGSHITEEFFLRGPNRQQFWRVFLFAGVWVSERGDFSRQWSALHEAGSPNAMEWSTAHPYQDPAGCES